MQKKGFTLMEIMVVVLIIGILFAMYSASYSNTKINRKNEKAVAMFVEFANAARLFNEMFPERKLVGSFGDTIVNNNACPNCVNPCYLFPGFDNDAATSALLHSFGLRIEEWDLTSASHCSTATTYDNGYSFTLCNPYTPDDPEFAGSIAQPDPLCNNSAGAPGVKFAVMSVPSDTDTYGHKYAGKHFWITKGYELRNDLNSI